MPRAASAWLAEVAREEDDARELAERLGAVAEPEVDVAPHHRWIWRAWWRLHADRPWRAGGMGPPIPGAIPWTVLTAWADREGCDDNDRDLLGLGIAAMDSEWMAWHEEQQRTLAPRR